MYLLINQGLLPAHIKHPQRKKIIRKGKKHPQTKKTDENVNVALTCPKMEKNGSQMVYYLKIPPNCPLKKKNNVKKKPEN